MFYFNDIFWFVKNWLGTQIVIFHCLTKNYLVILKYRPQILSSNLICLCCIKLSAQKLNLKLSLLSYCYFFKLFLVLCSFCSKNYILYFIYIFCLRYFVISKKYLALRFFSLIFTINVWVFSFKSACICKSNESCNILYNS